MWERCFVAASVLAGVSLEDAVAAAPEGSPDVAAFAARLRDPRKVARAAALAEAARDIAVAIDEVTVR